ncbi:RNA polymerase sigma factor [bacterium]|nr:RNA polymerase sigma factor [bacterium]
MNDENDLLIKDFLNGDLTAFRELIDSYAPRVQAIAYQMTGDSEDSQDIAQEVFLRLFRTLDRFDPKYSFSTWLYRITVNVSIDYLRKHRRPQERSLEEVEKDSSLIDCADPPGSELERNELKGAIERLAGNLSLKQRKVFVLRGLQDFSTSETAQILGCSQIAVRVHLAAARARVRDALLRHYPELVESIPTGRRK